MTLSPKRKRCWICESLTPAELRQFDAYLTAPLMWPETEREQLGSRMPGRIMQAKVGVAWLVDHGRADFGAPQIKAHLDHRAAVKAEVMDLVAAEAVPAGAIELMSFYAEAISAARKAIAKLVVRMNDVDDPLTDDQLFRLAGLGGKYAMSAAVLRQKGMSPLPGDEGYVPPEQPAAEPPPPEPPKQIPRVVDPMDGFLAGSAPRPSKKHGQVRVRVVEGVARPVRDEGTRDRELYNKTADQEGSPRL